MKKIFIILIVLIFSSSILSADVPCDVDGDNKIGLQEAVYALEVASGKILPDSGLVCDINGDSEVGLYEVISVLKVLAGVDLPVVPPHVTAVSPVDGAQEIDCAIVITATFSKPMDEVTINGTSFFLKTNNINVGGSVSFDPSANMAVFTPATNLAYRTEYTLTVSKDIADVTGSHLVDDSFSSFTTKSKDVEFISLDNLSESHSYTFGAGINNSGDVVGLYKDGYDNFPFIWTEAEGFKLLDVAYQGGVSGINDNGIISGGAHIGPAVGNKSYSPLRWDPVNGSSHLGFSSNYESVAYDINNAGDIVAQFGSSAYLWMYTGAIEDIGINSALTYPKSINDNMIISGHYKKEIDGVVRTQAYVMNYTEGTHTDIDVQGATDTYGVSINNNNVLVGNYIGDPSGIRPFILNNGSIQKIAPDDGLRYWAYDININNVVVGYYDNADGYSRAFVWSADSGMVDITSLIPANLGWTIGLAGKINDNNQIAGYGVKGGTYKAYRLQLGL